MIDIYGTLGPACANPDTLKAMFNEGMTGMRLNTSHISLHEAAPQLEIFHAAAAACHVQPKLLIDMQGPELRIGRLAAPIKLIEGSTVRFTELGENGGIPLPRLVLQSLAAGMQVLLDDGKLLLQMQSSHEAAVLRGGVLIGSKSIAVPDAAIVPPAMTEQDRINLGNAAAFGVTGVMQPFVRCADDLLEVRRAIAQAGCRLSLLAKIENLDGVAHLESFFGLADEIVIARGDLGNAIPLWELPRVQKNIACRCRAAGMPFMVVTQMLASMEHSAVPTRAEVSDIYNAVCDGAASVMVTGETAAGDHPIDVMRYLCRTVHSFGND